MIGISLVGKVALVTGAAGGLGLASALKLREAGATVVISDLGGERLEQTSEQHALQAIPADLQHQTACAALVDRVLEQQKRLDIVVACAGVMQTKPLLEISEAEWQRVLDINLKGTFLLVQTAAKAMQHGSMVLLSSVAGRSGRPNAPHYAASKSGLLSLTKSAAMALAPKIRVNAICPGVFFTPMWEGILADRDREFGVGAGKAYLEEVVAKYPLGRVGELEELSNAVLFLVSDMASFITGQALNVDGGLEMD